MSTNKGSKQSLGAQVEGGRNASGDDTRGDGRNAAGVGTRGDGRNVAGDAGRSVPGKQRGHPHHPAG